MADTPTARPYRLWQTEFLSEYLGLFHAPDRVRMNVRLGPAVGAMVDPTLTDEERRLVGASWRRWADALVIRERELVVIECDLIPKPGAISQLQAYMHLVDSTPELERERALRRRGVLLWAVGDPFVEALAARTGLTVVIHRPRHFAEWLGTIRHRERRSPVQPVPGISA